MRKNLTLSLVVILLTLVSFLLLDILGTTGLKGVKLLRQKVAEIRGRALPEPPTIRTQSAVLHHALLPNEERKVWWGDKEYFLRTNSLGMRDRAVRTVPLVSEKRRVLILGDSFMEGVGLPYESIVSAKLEDLAPSTEVLNAGVSSYFPSVYYRKAKQLWDEQGVRFDHALVFLDCSDIHDETLYHFDDKENIVANFSEEILRQNINQWTPLKTFVRENTFLTLAALSFWEKTSDPKAIRFALGQKRALWTSDDRYFNEFGKAGLEKAKSSLDLLNHYLSERKIKMSLVVYPWPDHIYKNDPATRHTGFWRDWATKNGVDFLDLFPHFTGDPEKTLTENFISGDAHWNESGHQKVASLLIENLPVFAK
jgi:hypothetical protein